MKTLKKIDFWDIADREIEAYDARNSCGILEVDGIGNFIFDCYVAKGNITEAVDGLCEHFRYLKKEHSKAFVMASILPPTKLNSFGMVKQKNYYKRFFTNFKKRAVTCTRPRINPNSDNQINIMIF